MKAIVTGGAGFIGSHIVDLLIENGHEVAIVDNLSTGRVEYLNPRARFYRMDVGDAELRDVFLTERPEVVFHEAAQMSVKASTEDPVHDARVNVLGLLNVLQASAAAAARKVVFASSGATFGNPLYLPIDEEHPQRPESPYGITKMVAEHYLRYFALDHGLAFTSLRYGNVFGPRQDSQGYGEAGVIAIFIRKLMAGQAPVIYWDGEQVRDYVYVTDVARANLLAATAGDGQCYCIGTGVGTSVNALYQGLSEELGVNLEPGRGPRRPGDLRTAIFSAQKAKAELGWEARVGLREGLAGTVAYWQQASDELPVVAGAR